ncbi:outer membrane protein assembly factor BamB family protein [Polyangium jinanense]|uniref:PQQ-binding-like beta-propeller repeat protein n=1 Tax=Polyangium jinanense TaxID=2829994 RepID=A0A9X3XEM6_9BACT|nr:PQQ-binding-like beta-propeller repeat protein [Polyangium jinanense]MDC3959022.1 PQQ-binding-like beta-propeller repeat protein [Polyangium jinanense]MDC3989214.1 PQQ-binding-like beta-propeller repeat protein [Polyangium jinanense]
MLLPEDAARYRAEALAALRAGRMSPECSIEGLAVKLSDLVRIRKLIAAVGSERLVLRYLAMDAAFWTKAQQLWGGILYESSTAARYLFLDETIDVQEEVEQIRKNGPTTTGLLEPGPAVVWNEEAREVWAIGLAFRGAEPPVLRAVAFERRAVVWESDALGVDLPEWRSDYAARGERLYVAVRDKKLAALDLGTGKVLFRIEVPENISYTERGERDVHDIHLPGGGGVVVIKTQYPQSIRAFDRVAGEPRWHFDPGYNQTVTAEVPGIGVLVTGADQTGKFAAVLDGRSGEILTVQGSRAGRYNGLATGAGVCGRRLVCAGARAGRGVGSLQVLVADAGTGELLAPIVEANVRPFGEPVFVGDRAFFIDAFERSIVAVRIPTGAGASPLEVRETTSCANGVRIQQILAASDSVVALLATEGLGAQLGIAVFDATSLALRGESGFLGGSSDPRERALVVSGGLAVLATRNHENGPYTLSAYDVQRGTRWAYAIDGGRAHAFAGPRIVVWKQTETLLLRAEDGMSIASL